MAQTQTAVTRAASDWAAALERLRPYAPFPLRLWVGWHLIYGTHDNLVSAERMAEFRDFLTQFGFPWPLLSAHVSVYAQFLCGVLFILGLFTRPAAAVMIFNFIVALLMVHTRTPYPQAALAFAMLTASVLLLLNGPGLPSIDAVLRRKGWRV